jgi:hypothetical protein
MTGAAMPNRSVSRPMSAAARLPGSGISEIAVNASLAFIEGAKPQDEVECALVMQMACTHTAAMSVLGTFAGAYGSGRDVPLKASAAARLMRAYATQVETLRRLRNGGSQVIRVERVYVNEVNQPPGRAAYSALTRKSQVAYSERTEYRWDPLYRQRGANRQRSAAAFARSEAPCPPRARGVIIGRQDAGEGLIEALDDRG